MKSFALVSALCSVTSAHFLLNYPPSIGFSDDDEGKAPCGGFTPDFSKQLFDFHVGGEALSMKLTHPQGNWLFRVTTDQKGETDWVQVNPILQQSGLGDFCQPEVTVPSNYTGKKGVVGVVSSAPDGLLYQCVAVNFVDGKGSKPSACTNSSGVTVSATNDSKLSALVGNGAGSSTTASPGTSASTTGASAAATSKGAAASLHAMSAASLGWGCALTVLSMGILGGALLI